MSQEPKNRKSQKVEIRDKKWVQNSRGRQNTPIESLIIPERSTRTDRITPERFKQLDNLHLENSHFFIKKRSRGEGPDPGDSPTSRTRSRIQENHPKTFKNAHLQYELERNEKTIKMRSQDKNRRKNRQRLILPALASPNLQKKPENGYLRNISIRPERAEEGAYNSDSSIQEVPKPMFRSPQVRKRSQSGSTKGNIVLRRYHSIRKKKHQFQQGGTRGGLSRSFDTRQSSLNPKKPLNLPQMVNMDFKTKPLFMNKLDDQNLEESTLITSAVPALSPEDVSKSRIHQKRPIKHRRQIKRKSSSKTPNQRQSDQSSTDLASSQPFRIKRRKETANGVGNVDQVRNSLRAQAGGSRASSSMRNKKRTLIPRNKRTEELYQRSLTNKSKFGNFSFQGPIKAESPEDAGRERESGAERSGGKHEISSTVKFVNLYNAISSSRNEPQGAEIPLSKVKEVADLIPRRKKWIFLAQV